jgi:hypothetical protein
MAEEHHAPRVHIIVEADGDAIRKVRFELDGERWTAPATHAVVFPDELGGWFVGWDDGSVGPFETREFAASVAREMRKEVASP